VSFLAITYNDEVCKPFGSDFVDFFNRPGGACYAKSRRLCIQGKPIIIRKSFYLLWNYFHEL